MAQGAAPQRELIESEGSRSAPYAAAVVYDRLVFTSGALPVADDGTVPAEFKAQVRVALGNLGDALEAAGADWSTVLKVNGYVVDIDRLPEMNEVYLEIVGEAAPCRTTVKVAGFRGDSRVEFDAIAYRRTDDGGAR